MKQTFFQRLRRPESNKSLVTYVVTVLIFGMITISFIFSAPGGGQVSGNATAAIVGGRVIPILQLQQRVQQLEEQSRMFLPEGSDQFRVFFQNQALNELINVEVLSAVEEKEGLYVPDTLLAKTISDIPAFQEKGHFQRDLYENYLANSGMSAGALETRIKKDMRLGILRDLFTYSFLPTHAEQKVYGDFTDFKIKMDYLDVSSLALASRVKVSDQDIETALKDESFVKRAKDLYERESFKFEAKDKVKAKWILVLVKDHTDESDKEAKEKLEAETKNLTAANFSEVAEKVSEDPTAAQGGELGYIERGTFDTTWDEVAFNLDEGKISSAFRVPQGWAKLLVEEKKMASQKGFEDVKLQVGREQLLMDKSQELIQEIKSTIANNPQGLEKLLASKGLKWQTAPEFKLSADTIPGMGSADAVFNGLLTLKKDGDVYGDVVSSEGKSYFIKRRHFDVNAEANPDFQTVVASRLNYALGSWLESQRENVKIRINPLVQSKESIF